jgi:hypothetical protein
MRPAFHAALPVITSSEAVGFKIGADLSYLARPDKIVVYFCSHEETLRVGRLLEPMLVDCPAHGVPFTCPIDGSGLVSWGMDPPDDVARQESWRLWLAQRLAEAMTEAPIDDQVDAALTHAESLGIDPTSWDPRGVVWRPDGSN